MLARLHGKSNIYEFKIEIFGNVQTHDFLKVNHHESGDVLCQVVNITRDRETLIGDCKIVGYRDSGILRTIRTPFQNDADVQLADDSFIEKTVGLNIDMESFIGVLEHHPDLRISLDLKKTITKHIAVLAKSGAGKSYTVGVLLEEVMKKNIPIVILDPHNEYASIKYPNTDKKDLGRLEKFGLTPNGFLDRVVEYSPDTKINTQCMPITLDVNRLQPQDLIESLPQKISPAQQSLIFNVLSNLNNRVNFDELIFNISNEESNARWGLIALIEQLKKLNLYSSNPTPLNEIVKYKQTSIISLKGAEPYISETFVAGLLKELFEARKKEEIPPFLLVLEEAHNFCPERGFGELKSSKVIRTIAGEGRKFGIGLCVISQRPAKVDKNVVSQCTTQILLKMTNPNDIKSVIASSEGVDSSSEQEIQKLNIGTCLLTGVIDIPLKVNIRPRITKHGGETVDITLPYEVEEQETQQQKTDSTPAHSTFGDLDSTDTPKSQHSPTPTSSKEPEAPSSDFYEGKNKEFLQFIAPEIEADDAKVMLDAQQIECQLIPATVLKFTQQGKSDEIQLVIDKLSGTIVKSLFPFEGTQMSQSLLKLTSAEEKLISHLLELENDKFNPAELLLKTNMMFNEILRLCETLAQKSVLKKLDKQYELSGLAFAKDLAKLNFYGQQKFEELSYDVKLDEVISNEEIKKVFSYFGEVTNMKDLHLVKYVGK